MHGHMRRYFFCIEDAYKLQGRNSVLSILRYRISIHRARKNRTLSIGVVLFFIPSTEVCGALKHVSYKKFLRNFQGINGKI